MGTQSIALSILIIIINYLTVINYFSVQQCNEVKSITADHDNVLTSAELKMLPFEAFLAKVY